MLQMQAFAMFLNLELTTYSGFADCRVYASVDGAKGYEQASKSHPQHQYWRVMISHCLMRGTSISAKSRDWMPVAEIVAEIDAVHAGVVSEVVGVVYAVRSEAQD